MGKSLCKGAEGKEMKIDVLGREYTISIKDVDEDETLKKENLDGYCDNEDANIVIRKKENPKNMNASIRHELIHAFLFESGLGFNWEHNTAMGHDETFVDWFAMQYPKIHKLFQKLEIED